MATITALRPFGYINVDGAVVSAISDDIDASSRIREGSAVEYAEPLPLKGKENERGLAPVDAVRPR